MNKNAAGLRLRQDQRTLRNWLRQIKPQDQIRVTFQDAQGNPLSLADKTKLVSEMLDSELATQILALPEDKEIFLKYLKPKPKRKN